MNIVKKMKLVVGSLLVLTSSLVSANLITANGNEANALELNTSFETFYNWGNGNQFSSNTGLEVANSVVAFLAKTTDDLALFMIFSDDGGDAGRANFDITGSVGGISFVDDSNDPVNGSNVQFTYAANRTDGLIFSGLTDASFSVDVIFNSLTGIDNLTFLTFDSQGADSVLFVTNGVPQNLNISAVAVSAPLTSVLMISALAFLFLRRK